MIYKFTPVFLLFLVKIYFFYTFMLMNSILDPKDKEEKPIERMPDMMPVEESNDLTLTL